MSANAPPTPPTVPSTSNEDDDEHSIGNIGNVDLAPQQAADEQQTGAISTFSSPRLNNPSNTQPQQSQLLQQNVPFQHTISAASAGTGTGTQFPIDSTHTTPLLNGENIVLLSFSNDTTPADTPFSTTPADTPVGTNILGENEQQNSGSGSGRARANFAAEVGGAIDEILDHHDAAATDVDELNDMTLSPSSIVLVDDGGAHSPPPDSVQSGQLTALSPPPISTTSRADTTGQHTSSGSQGLFSRGERAGAPSHMQQQQPQQPPTVSSAPSKKRPPLPPRWALGGPGGLPPGIAASHHAGMVVPPTQPIVAPVAAGGGGGDVVDVVPGHLFPPPKQIGPLSHRRVLSTGDASFLSNLTDPDSMPDGEHDASPPAAVAAGGAGGMAALYNASGGVPPGTMHPPVAGASPAMQPLPMNPARKRGVSWDFGATVAAGGHGDSLEGGGSIVATNRYKNEEEAAFDTLGILQPILLEGMEDERDAAPNVGGLEGGPGDPAHLMQPILTLDDENQGIGNGAPEPVLGGTSSAFASSAAAGVRPPPPPPPEEVVRKQASDRSIPRPGLAQQRATSTRSAASGPSRPGLAQRAKSAASSRDLHKKAAKVHTQFEDEAEMAILKALNAHKMELDHIDLSQDEEEEDEEDENILKPIEDEEEEVPDQVVPSPPSHRKDVSALTIPRFSPNPTHSRKRGESLLEDSAWTEEYDAAGRIDGTLPEEQDAKFVGKGEAGKVDLKPKAATKAGAVAGAMAGAMGKAAGAVKGATSPMKPPLHPVLSPKSHGSSQGSSPATPSKKTVKHPSKDELDAGKTAKAESPTAGKKELTVDSAHKDPTATTGLRHRRGKTTHDAKDIAEELAQMDAMHRNDNSPQMQHQRTKTGITHLTNEGGVDNLMAGVDLLAQQINKSSDRDVGRHGDDHAANADGHAEAHRDEEDENAPHDEETGEASKKPRPSTPRASQRGSTMGRRSEMLWHLGQWYRDLIRPKVPAFIRAATHTVLFVQVPLISIAFILYYAVGNPMAGNSDNPDVASWSWWVLFFSRAAFLLSCVKTGEIITIDILALRTPFFLKTIGSFGTLIIVQARGWPYVLTYWSLMCFCFLFGSHAFARHWLFWQDWVGLFNDSNPAGTFLHSTLYIRILCAMLFVGVFTSLKRLWLAFFLGRRSYAHYGPELEVILAKMLMVSQVAHLGRQIESQVTAAIYRSAGYAYTMGNQNVSMPVLSTDSEDEASPFHQNRRSLDESSRSHSKSKSHASQTGFGQSLLDAGIGGKLVDSLARPRMEKTPTERLKSTKRLGGSSAKLEILALLEEWEEPAITANAKSKASIKDILHFRQAVAMMDDTYPFTRAFGNARTRALCVESSESLFDTLLSKDPDNSSHLLPFETLSEICYDGNGELIREKAKALIRLFRPDRKGFLTKLDFVSSIDDVYKDLRLFRASLANSSSIDVSFETIINVVFYLLTTVIVLFIVGFKMWEPIISFSAFFFSFSFMFGPASSKYFEGILLIFVRRPYDIGDKIALSDPETDTSAAGSSTWFVEKVSLYTTTVRFATTNEVATYSNGSLARLRIINAKRSPKAIIYVYMKFGSDVPFQMIKVYQTAIENFVKGRPREWSQLNGFRATRVEMELNYIEYVIVATHREMWQNVGPILQSQADLASFSLEVSKKLNLRYHNPPKPIHLSMSRGMNADHDADDENYGLQEIQQVARLFGTGKAEGGADE